LQDIEGLEGWLEMDVECVREKLRSAESQRMAYSFEAKSA
jgi:hypothetical protein